jgi:signal transduction histidine kinase
MDHRPIILIVDDEPKNIRLLRALLTLQDYVVITAESGHACVEAVARQRVDLILLDVMMPGMDGFEVLRVLRADPSHRLIPIVLVTALDAAEDRVRGIDAGCDDFISKPFDHSELLARIKTSLTLSYYRRQLDEKEKLAAAIAATRDAIVVCSPDWQVQQFNPIAKELFDLRLGSNESLLDTLRRRYRATVTAPQLAGIEHAPVDFELIRDPTEHFGVLHLRAFATLIRNAAGAPSSVLLSAHDVTELVREQGLKADFVSLISHKLRTPLTPIMMYLSLMKDGTIPQDQLLPIIDQVSSHVGRLHVLIERLIEFASTAQNSQLSNRTNFSVTDRLQALIDARGTETASGRTEFQPEGPDLFVEMHPSLFDLAVGNLIDNALKFNDSKQPRAVVRGRIKDDGVVVSVSDNGRGIPPEHQKRIFDGFMQLERNFTGSVPGAGLGLAIVQRIVSAYGGHVTVESQLGRGSTFTMWLPAARRDPAWTEPTSTPV